MVRGAGDMHVGMGEVLREWNDLDAARQHLQTSTHLGEHLGLAQNPWRWRAAMARIREAEGDLEGAIDCLHEADRLYVSDYSRTSVRSRRGRRGCGSPRGSWPQPEAWAREQGLSANDDLSYLREFEHLTLARVLLARPTQDGAEGSKREAVDLLDRLQLAAETGSRTGSVISVTVLLALAHQMRGDIPAALAQLERALALAEPEGYVRVFVDEGPPMAALLAAAATRGLAPTYVRRLLGAFGRGDRRRRSSRPLSSV